jgi:hypothetical protein
MSQFPIILIPIEVLRVLRELPAVQKFQERLPKYTGVEPQPVNTWGLIWEVSILMMLAGALSWLNRILGTVILLIGFVAIFFQIRLQIVSYNQRQRDYSARTESYFKSLIAYSKKESQHQQAIALSQSPEKLAEFRRPLLLQALSHTAQIPDPITSKLTIALTTEDSAYELVEALNHYFPDRIYMDIKLNLPVQDQPYSPLLTYCDRTTNLCIAIEVDAPCDRDRNPTHYKDSWQDQKINESLVKLGWLVVRFSSDQASKMPRSCCKTIAKLIYDLFADTDLLLKFNEVDDLIPAKQWTEPEARQMTK